MNVSRSSPPCMRVDCRLEVRQKDLRAMRRGPLCSADKADSPWGLSGFGWVTMRREPGRSVFVGPGTTGPNAAAQPWAPA